MPGSSLVGQLRGRVVAHSLCNCFGCRHDGPALERCGCAWTHQHHSRINPKRNNKWPRLLTGNELHDACLKELLMDFPALWPVRTNSIWAVLRTLWEERKHTDQLAQTLRLKNGWLLPAHSTSLMHRLCDCPDWRNLGFVLALLGSKSSQFQSHRRWLRTHFLNYLLLVCMTEPGCFIREPLYELLNEIYVCGFFELNDDWPSDFATFEQARQDLNRYGDWMRYQGWISDWDLYACALLQHYRPDQDVQRQCASLLVGPPVPLVGPPVPVVLPQQVARRIVAKLKRHRRDQFAMEGRSPRSLVVVVLSYGRGGEVRLQRQVIGERKPSHLQSSMTAAYCG
jgi:hypothetical protein